MGKLLDSSLISYLYYKSDLPIPTFPGGNKIKVWDVHRGVGALATVSNHQKTITCLALDHTNTKLISGSLDQ